MMKKIKLTRANKCHPQDVAKRQAANLMQDLLNNQNPCYVAFMKNKNRKAKKAG